MLRRPVDFALAAVIGVVQQLPGRVAPPEGHHQRGDDEVGGLAFAHRPTDQRVVVEVADPCQVELAVATAELGDVGDPSLIGALGGEVPLQQVRCRRHGGVAASTPLASPMRPDEALSTHQAGHPMPAGVMAGPAELTSDARRPIGSAGALVDLADLGCQLGIDDGALGGRPVAPRVVGGARHLRRPTQIHHRVVGFVLVNEPEADHRCVSLAK